MNPLEKKIFEALVSAAVGNFLKKAETDPTGPEGTELGNLIKNFTPSALADKETKAREAEKALKADRRKEFDELYKTPTSEKIMLDFALPAAGDIAQMIGNYSAIKNGMFAAALAASQAGKAHGGIRMGDDLDAKAAGINSAVFGARGALGKMVGDTVGGRIKDTASRLKSDNEKDRLMRQNFVEGAGYNNGMYDYLRALDRRSYN